MSKLLKIYLPFPFQKGRTVSNGQTCCEDLMRKVECLFLGLMHKSLHLQPANQEPSTRAGQCPDPTRRAPGGLTGLLHQPGSDTSTGLCSERLHVSGPLPGSQYPPLAWLNCLLLQEVFPDSQGKSSPFPVCLTPRTHWSALPWAGPSPL